MRSFVAIELSAPVRAACRGLVGRLRAETSKVRWVTPENIHLTLRFLGDVAPETGESLMECLAPHAAAMAPFEARAEGLGCFPHARRPSVVWVGVREEGGALLFLQAAIEQCARDAGLEPETRRFHPHLTLGRIRQPGPATDWDGIVARHADFDAGAWTVSDVALFASELHPSGARYTRIRTLSLGNAE